MSQFPSPDDGGGEMAAHDNVSYKRHRRPSVRLVDIGSSGAGDLSSFDKRRLENNKASMNRHSTNLSTTHTFEDDAEDANLDDIAIGNWKVKNLKSKKVPIAKKMRSGWTPKAKHSGKDDKMASTDVENLESSPVHSHDITKTNDDVNMVIDIDRRISNVNGKKRATRVSEDGPTDGTEVQDLNFASERNGVKVWLNQLGLVQYASLFEIHEVDYEVLPMLTLDDLKEIGVSAVGSRRKMYCAIQNLNKGFS
ncbi:unnamed protein product [Withania somnifera]